MALAARRTPGIYIEEIPSGPKPITAVGTSTAGFVGEAPLADAFPLKPQAVNNWSEFKKWFVGDATEATDLSTAVYGFFENRGGRCWIVNTAGERTIAGGLDKLRRLDEIAIVLAPGKTDALSHSLVQSHCEALRDRVGIVDIVRDVDDFSRFTEVEKAPPQEEIAAALEGREPKAPRGGKSGAAAADDGPGGVKLAPSPFVATYWPWISAFEPLSERTVLAPPSGHVAGMWARVDADRGVHKAPANEQIAARDLSYDMTRDEQAVLNDNGVNGIRNFSREGIRVWGARTSDDPASEWRYVSVRRLFNMIEESIEEGTNWVVFEPNDRTLWKHVRRDVGAFLTRVWRDGALMGATPEEAFFVKCDDETNPQDVIDAGELHALIGIAPVKPAEFIVFEISQSTAGAEITG